MMVSEDKDSVSGSQQRPLPRPGAHYLAKYVLRGSAVLQAVQGHLRSPTSDDIVFGKETSLELVVFNDGVVQSICEQPVFGIIKDLAVVGWTGKSRQSWPQMIGKDLLVVLSDSGKLSFLAFSFEMHRFLAVDHIQLSKPGNSIHHIGRMLAVDPDGYFIAASAFEDQFVLFSFSTYAGDSIIDEKMFYPPENKGEASSVKDTVRTNIRGTIWSMCFVSHGTDHSSKGYYPTLATIMHRKGRLRNELLLFGCTLRTRVVQFISSYPEAESGPLALSICAVPHLSGFAIVFRIGDALLMDFTDPYCIRCVQRINIGLPSGIDDPDSFQESSRGMDIDDEGMSNVAVCALLELSDSAAAMAKDNDPMSIDNGIETASTSKHVCAFSWEPSESEGANLILCLDTGEIYILEIHFTTEEIRVLLSDCLYKCAPCKDLIWLKGGFIVGLVEMGDGLVLKLDDDAGVIFKSHIQNIAPILDFSVIDDHDEKQDLIFSCSGMSPVGSLRILRSGLSVEKLVKTAPIYQGITGTWTLMIKKSDLYHSFLVLSFIEETRVLSVGLNFFDSTDATGFHPDVCTLACGLISDGLLVQIHRAGVKLCSPTKAAHVKGFPLSLPFCTSWCPGNSISSGAVGHNAVIVATSNPCFLIVLGVRSSTTNPHELYEIQRLRLQHEVSCMFIPEEEINFKELLLDGDIVEKDNQETSCNGDALNLTFVIGTHVPSVEVLSFTHNRGFRFLATGEITIDNALGTPLSSCIPEDVRLVLVDRFYVLAGLRNGMLFRYEFPQSSRQSSSLDYCAKNSGNCSSVLLQLIAIRRIGKTPVVLVPLRDSLDADVVVLSERPWFLHVSRHSIACTSISFQPATHATCVSSFDCPNGILFVADNRLHLVELDHCKRLNARKFSIEGTPRKILYHKDSKTLLILRTGLRDASFSSDICRLDPVSGVLLSKFTCEPGETAKCMQIMRIGYQHLLVVGTSQCPGRTIMPSGEAESAKGRLIVLSLDNVQNSPESNSLISNFSSPSRISSSLPEEAVGHATERLSCASVGSSPEDASNDSIKIEEMEAAHLRVIYQNQLPGAVLAICSFLDRYLLASAGNILNVFCFVTDNPLRLRKHSMTKTRFTITCLTTYYTRIVVGDCRDGVLFYSYTDDLRKLEQLFSDPAQRLVADCTLLNMDIAVVSDRRGSISVLSNVDDLEGSESPEKNLFVNCSFYMGETVMSIQKGLSSYRLSMDGILDESDHSDIVYKSLYNSIVASTLLGSVLIIVPVTREEHYLLETVQTKLAVHPLTAPVIGNDHKEFRGRGTQAGVPTILDGDMLIQFLELTREQQEAVLSIHCSEKNSPTFDSSHPISVNQVIQTLERIHHALS